MEIPLDEAPSGQTILQYSSPYFLQVRMQVLLASSVTTHRVFFVLFNFFLPHRQLMQEGTISVSSIQCCLLRIQTSCLTSPKQKESLNESDNEIIMPALFSQLYLKG